MMFRTMWRRATAAAVGVGVACGAASAQTVVYPQASGVPGVYLVGGQKPGDTPAAAVPDPGAAHVAPPVMPSQGPGCATAACDATPLCAVPQKQTCRNSGCWGGPFGLRDCSKKPATAVPPVGYSTRMANDTMRLNALAEYFVVFREEWDKGAATLNATGERHLEGIARRLCQSNAPVKVEPSGNAQLDALRTAALAEALLKAGVADATTRVVVGGTRAEGLRGEEVEAVFRRSPFSPGGGSSSSNQNGGYGGFGGFGGGLGGFGGYGYR